MNTELMQMPSAVEAERVVLGAVMRGAAFSMVEHLEPGPSGHFTTTPHVRIFDGMRALYAAGCAIDGVTLAQALRDASTLDSVGGMAYLVSLDEGMPDLPNIPDYVRILEEKHALRSVLRRVQKVAMEASGPNSSSAGVLGTLTRCLEEIAPLVPGKGLPTVSSIVDEIGASRILGDGKLVSFPTPWAHLDEITGGIRPGELIIVGARPSSGKTVILTQMARHMAGAGYTVAVISVEMSRDAILQRMIAADGGVALHKLRNGYMDAQERGKAQEALGTLYQLNGLLLGDGGSTLPRLRASLTKIAAKRKIDAVAVDYLQLISGPSGQRRVEQITEISRGLKQLAVDLDCAMIVASQLSRESVKEEREPRLDDLRDSGSIEQDADVVIFPHRIPGQPAEERFVRTELIVAKNRNGRLGRCLVTFEKPYVRFREAA
jgi:replicative DNA helicase